MTFPRASSQANRADSGPSVLPSGRAAPYDSASSDREVSGGLNPEPGQGGAVTPATSLTVGTTPAASAVGGFSCGLARFFDTLGIADDMPWRPAFDGDQPPF